jgi:hypothetical protein
MTRQQVQDQLIAALAEDNVEAAEYWQDALDRMDETGAEIWLS